MPRVSGLFAAGGWTLIVSWAASLVLSLMDVHVTFFTVVLGVAQLVGAVLLILAGIRAAAAFDELVERIVNRPHLYLAKPERKPAVVSPPRRRTDPDSVNLVNASDDQREALQRIKDRYRD